MNIETLIGCLYIIAASMVLCTIWCYLTSRRRQREVRREMAARYTISARVTKEQPGRWRPEGAGARNERGAW